MNDFHILSLCVQNKDVAGAMRVLRDKSEFAARKILEKIKVTVTSLTGRAFWHDVQRWLLNACRQESKPYESVTSRCPSASSRGGEPQSGRPGHDQSAGAGRHAHRPRQYPAADSAGTPDVCAWPDGLPPVHAYLGDERAAHAGTASEEGKPAVDVGDVHPAGLQPGLCRASALVGTEHPVRVRGCHAAAHPAVPLRNEGTGGRRSASGDHGLATPASKLRTGRPDAGRRSGDDDGREVTRRAANRYCPVRSVAVLPERGVVSAESAGRHAAVCHPAYPVTPPDGHIPQRPFLPTRHRAFYAPPLLLYRLCRTPADTAHPDASLVRGAQPRGVTVAPG